jgi:hypothetical protein
MGPKSSNRTKRSRIIDDDIIDLTSPDRKQPDDCLRPDEDLLGKQPPFDIWHESYTNKFHHTPHPAAIFDDEEEQTYDQFIEIGKRPPNSRGTGRWKLTKQRSKVALYYFGKSYEQHEQQQQQQQQQQRGQKKTDQQSQTMPITRDLLHHLKEFIAIYLQVEVDFFEQFEAIDLEDKCFQLSGLQYDIIRFPPSDSSIKSRGNKKKKVTSSSSSSSSSSLSLSEYDRFGPRVDVFSLFDVLVHEAKEPYISIVGLFDCALGEGVGKSYTDVLGRACGDRVACVSLPFCESFKSLLCNTVHELLHTIGFDHCTSYQCLMNAIGYEDWIFLSPVNLRKLKAFHNQQDNDDGDFMVKRYKQMLELFRSFEDKEFEDECQWLEGKLAALHKLSSSTIA